MNKVFPIFNRQTQNKFEILVKEKSPRDYLLWLVGTHTGLRIGDILKLKVKDIQKSINLNIKEQKTNKIKKIRLSEKLRQAVKKFIEKFKLSADDFLFTSRQSHKKPMTRQRVHQIIKYLASKIGLEENISTHSMRKTFAYNLYKLSNNNIALVMEALNHSKEVITLRYLCIKDKILNELVEQL